MAAASEIISLASSSSLPVLADRLRTVFMNANKYGMANDDDDDDGGGGGVILVFIISSSWNGTTIIAVILVDGVDGVVGGSSRISIHCLNNSL